MSKAEVNIQHVADSIPIGRRISEVMEEKGDAFSIRAFAKRIDMNRETLRSIINGERTVLPSEFEKIASGLDISVKRLKQSDSMENEIILTDLLARKKTLKKALKIARELADLAIGLTEKAVSLNNLGSALFLLQEYPNAHRVWLDAFPLAQRIKGKYGEIELYNKLTYNLMISYTMTDEYTNIDLLLEEVERTTHKSPDRLGIIYYTRGKMAEKSNQLTDAKQYAYKSLQYFEATGNRIEIGKAQINVAHYEYLTGKYQQSVEALQSAISNLESYRAIQLIAVKELAKSLIKLKQRTRASELIASFLPLSEDEPEVKAKLMILLSICSNTITHAESVANNIKNSPDIRILSCRHLMKYYTRSRDSELVMKYYEIAESLSSNKLEIYDEEVF